MYGARMQHVRSAVERFMGELLRPEDEACLLTFNHEPRVVVPWTEGPAALANGLDEVRPWGGTALYDGLMSALPLVASRRHQRAAVLLVSDGADNASDADLQDVRAQLWRTDAFIYAIAIDPPKTVPINARVNPDALRDISDPSGGYTAVIHDTDELGAATSRIADELNQQYLLGYTPEKPPQGDYRRIRVRVKQPGHTVRARRGYVATPARRS
jgi:VWFA-related protein